MSWVQENPVANNREGSYLTVWSLPGIKFGILQVCIPLLCENKRSLVSMRHIMQSNTAQSAAVLMQPIFHAGPDRFCTVILYES